VPSQELDLDIQEIYRLYQQDVYHFLIYFTHQHNDAEDLMHEVFIRALKALPSFTGASHIKTWLLGIAKNTAIDFFRKKKLRSLFSLSKAKEMSSEEMLPEAFIERREEFKELHDVLSQLKPHYRAVVILRGIKELSIKETAEILNCTEENVKVSYFRGLKMMKKHLTAREEAYHESRA